MILRIGFCLLALAVELSAEPLKIALPTENQHLFSGEPEKFYMYVDRTFEGETSQPWEGGSFGYVRSPIRVSGKVVMSRFHEGVDISPVKRDKAGNPLDLVMSIADGMVVHTSKISGRSNYGNYVVVEHDWENSKVCSLYAHLAEVTVEPGDTVKMGSVLGRMGYTGVGLDRTRAHVHLELGLLMSMEYQGWHDENFGSANYHGNYNGMNIAGVDVASFFTEHRANPELTFSEFVLSRPMQFKVAVPAGDGEPEFLTRYPWMRRPGSANPSSWEIGFAATGHAISFTPSERVVTEPVVTHLRPAEIPQRWLTRGLLQGEGSKVSLSPGGRSMVALVMDDFPKAQ
ncbi:MAG: M23 family metallopeptidase [Akkermansiaceae bacterium]|jgi:murein DD-endopeptidase MepM/ murein hydrolase activator NlpD|nr:M23 family metallopeptidase [Akkermansiaceae bacterium]MDP4647960.1 M23 family metallopeptidase [Akkermansiaceae bacterium]MDP4719750.1 M23 family metallopeptidase [Akkermansiaceae bacterium]MDP4781305.1 M23 family metallopeptidase [Akkermansiaceae bacterium]MDP4846061.1 M23 family metallopeptidase [Akkermansiaceae bacterium]